MDLYASATPSGKPRRLVMFRIHAQGGRCDMCQIGFTGIFIDLSVDLSTYVASSKTVFLCLVKQEDYHPNASQPCETASE